MSHDLLLGGIGFVVNWRDRIVGHVGDMYDSAVDGGSRGGCEIFFVAFASADVVASVDVDVPESREDQAVVRERFVSATQMRPDFYNAIPFDPDLAGDDLFGTDESAGDQHGGLPW